MRYVTRNHPIPSQTSLAIDRDIRLLWQRCSRGEIDPIEANRAALELIHIQTP
jgi:hypothetical protein